MHNVHQTELTRLATLASYNILDSAAEDCFDRLARLAARICETPIATIAFIDAERAWFKSTVGLDLAQTARATAFCARGIGSSALFMVQDARSEPLFADNPLTAAGHGVRFYAGMPLIAPEGVALGTLNVMDRVPRVLTPLQVEALETLAQQVVAQLLLRRQRLGSGAAPAPAGAHEGGSGKPDEGAAGVASDQRFRQLADAMPYIVWSARANGEIDFANKSILDYAGLGSTEGLTERWITTLHPDDVCPTLAAWAESVRTGNNFSAEYRLLLADDSTYHWHMAKAMPIRDEHGAVTKWYGTTMDIHDMKLAHQEIGRLAFYDALTELPNRQLLMDRLSHAISRHERGGRTGAVMLLDLDDFKAINDTLGHHVGDLLLGELARRLRAGVRPNDTVARLGGDEFVVILEDIGETRDAAALHASQVAHMIRDGIDRPFNLAGHERYVTASIGVAMFGGTPVDVGELLKRGDLAMYQAKAAGRNNICFFDPKIQAASLARAAMEIELRCALQEGQFVLHYQPQVSYDGQVTGVEALVRWNHPQRGMVSPAEFISLAEETGLILPLGRWVLETACAQLALLNGQPSTSAVCMSVNVSALQFRRADFVTDVLEAVRQAGARPDRLKIELTESLLLDDVESAIDKITHLKAHGVCFSLDDFGTGYSSLSYLKRLPLDQLKIDQSFVRNLMSDPKDSAIVSTIITLGHMMGMAVVAEGVETEAQRAFLAERGCRSYQGYLFSRPLSCENMMAFVAGRAGAAPDRLR